MESLFSTHDFQQRKLSSKGALPRFVTFCIDLRNIFEGTFINYGIIFCNDFHDIFFATFSTYGVIFDRLPW